jgi:hypothetical protein
VVAASALLDLPKKMPVVAGGFVMAEENCRIWLPWAPPIARPPYVARWPGACPNGLAEGDGPGDDRGGRAAAVARRDVPRRSAGGHDAVHPAGSRWQQRVRHRVVVRRADRRGAGGGA